MSCRKAIALMSGGLDSNLAVRIVHDMGIEIVGVHFTGPFCLCNRGATWAAPSTQNLPAILAFVSRRLDWGMSTWIS